jgi:NAD(P)-dependent dehydrogenase (short-subunit alcohol dehydrogenase family)
MNNQKVWFITGASKGLGLSMVKQLLAQGYKVAATSRAVSQLEQAVSQRNTRFLPLRMDLKNEEEVASAIKQAVDHFGRIDVVVNNAGYGLAGSIEELTDEEARENFNINVFGMLNVIRKVMPYLRKQCSGHIINISSIGGFTGGFAGWSIYCATKFAVQGLTESLAAEAREFGVNVTVVSPGYFRTNFLSAGSMAVPATHAYKAVRASQELHQENLNGHQQGDPEKGVAAIIKMGEAQNPPLHFFLGQDAYDLAYHKMDAVKHDLEAWKEVTTSTAYHQENLSS